MLRFIHMAENFFDEPKPRKNWLPLIGIVVLVLLLAGGAYWFFAIREKAPSVADGDINFAREGKLVEAFPGEIPIEENVVVEESYRIKYDNGNDQPVVVYTSDKSLLDNFNYFKGKLVEGKWNIMVEDQEGPVGMIYANRDMTDVNITLAEGEDGKVSVNIAYLIR